MCKAAKAKRTAGGQCALGEGMHYRSAPNLVAELKTELEEDPVSQAERQLLRGHLALGI